ncbi:MAG: prepilin-type N-terminal cleavage/methylation domain-containing protein, partial [Desulfuromusa sp.]|nr:prepilin-type N-terminal cleavage/methylation domain-containing protein [Desulfuromusa sp.]
MRSGARGFTLIEILLAILIGSLVLTSIYGI